MSRSKSKKKNNGWGEEYVELESETAALLATLNGTDKDIVAKNNDRKSSRGSPKKKTNEENPTTTHPNEENHRKSNTEGNGGKVLKTNTVGRKELARLPPVKCPWILLPV
jgi:hypothetical protein